MRNPWCKALCRCGNPPRDPDGPRLVVEHRIREPLLDVLLCSHSDSRLQLWGVTSSEEFCMVVGWKPRRRPRPGPHECPHEAACHSHAVEGLSRWVTSLSVNRQVGLKSCRVEPIQDITLSRSSPCGSVSDQQWQVVNPTGHPPFAFARGLPRDCRQQPSHQPATDAFLKDSLGNFGPAL